LAPPPRNLAAIRRAQGNVPATVVFGVRGSGKTSWLRHKIRTTVTRTDWLVNDPSGEFEPEDFGGRATVLQHTGEMYRTRRPKPGWAYIFRAATNEEVAQLAMDMGHVAVAFNEGDSDFRGFVDEDSACWAVYNKSRQFFVAPYTLARRPTDVVKGARCNVTHAVFTFTQDEDDLDNIRALCGVPGVDDAVAALPHPRWPAGRSRNGGPAARKDGVYVVECCVGLEFRTVFIPHRGT
jgi:hypothetical protein